jgi:thiol reductant ABC exporter CydD subunit
MMKRLFNYDKSAKWLLSCSVGLGLLGGVFIIGQAALLSYVTDRVFLHGWSLGQLGPPMLLMLGIIGMRIAVQAVSEYASAQMSIRIKSELRKQLVRHIRELGPAFVRKEKSGELLSTVVEGVEQLDVYLAKYIPQIAMSALIPVAVFVLVAGIDGLTAAILAVTFPLLILFMILIGQGTKAYTRRQWKQLSLLSGHFLDVLRGLLTLRIFNRSRHQLAVISRVSEAYRSATMSTLRIAFLSAFVMELFATLSTALIAVFLGLRLISGDINFQTAFLVLLLAPEFYLPIRALGTQFHAGQNGTAAAERIFRILDTEPLGWIEKEGGLTPSIAEGRIEIRFEEVGFTYPGSEQPVLSGLNFTIEAGERLVVIGTSGAGKSTLLELLHGHLRPTEGRIRVNGVEMGELSMAWWREQLASMEQKPHLFVGSIADNIRLARPDAPMVEVVSAAVAAQADPFIRQLPAGYDTILGESVQFSAGQISRLAAARVFLKQAPVLLLDEPMSRLDAESEYALQSALEQLWEDRTAVVVAHRLGIASLADRVLVLEEGRIAEYGNPSQLLQDEGMYARMLRVYKEAAQPSDPAQGGEADESLV